MSPATPSLREHLWRLIDWLHGFRYVRFGLVGASGTVVNLALLYTAHEYLFRALEPVGSKPYFSLALAICVATVNNFTWNRLWTWSDRQHATAVDDGFNADGLIEAWAELERGGIGMVLGDPNRVGGREGGGGTEQASSGQL